MTTAPRAKRFRLRPEEGALKRRDPGAPPEDEVDDGFGDRIFPTAEAATGDANDAELAALQEEGLSARQLRTARRVAQKHGISFSSDLDAVRQLRRRGIDPFQPSALLKLVDGRKSADEVHLPQKVPDTPVPAPLTEAERAAEILEIQRDIVRRRRRRLMMLFARLAVLVFLPTLIAGIYYFRISTPLYATHSEFVIQQSENPAAGIASMFRGTQFATAQDSIAVQSYLQSRDAMLRLDRDHGFRAHFSQPSIDPLTRLEPDATNEDLYRLYRKMVKISYDPTEGIVKMEVVAADPETSKRFAEALVGYAEEQVDQLSARLRENQMKDALAGYQDAERRVLEAQARVQTLQEELGVLDPLTESNALMGQISGFEIELQKKRLELEQLLDNPRPNQARVDGVRGDIERLERLITQLRSQLTQGGDSSASLAQVMGQLRIAEAELETRQMLLAQAVQQLETARLEANRQTRYLETSVSPVAPDEPAYPRAFENTLLAFLLFSGIYLMLSITASILREQATT